MNYSGLNLTHFLQLIFSSQLRQIFSDDLKFFNSTPYFFLKIREIVKILLAKEWLCWLVPAHSASCCFRQSHVAPLRDPNPILIELYQLAGALVHRKIPTLCSLSITLTKRIYVESRALDNLSETKQSK